jgi:oxygen-dependent protoporphyrinogen oxidase
MIVIIGAGISGLALAHQLAKRGVPFTVLEASGRAGGVIRSGRVAGHLLEWGPQRGRLTEGFRELVDDLGIADRIITAPPDLPLYVFRRGGLREVPYSVPAFLRSDILSWPGKLRILLEPFTAAPRDDESVAALFTRKIGREAYENLVGPLYGGLYASDPRDMIVGLSLRHVLQEFHIRRSFLVPLARRGGSITPPDACSFVDGLQSLPDALLQRHAAHVHLEAPARELRPVGDGYVVITDGEPLAASHVVITTPADEAARLLETAAPEAAVRCARLHYNPLGVVHLHAETELRGLGYQVSFAESLFTRGVTWNDSLFARHGVYTAYLGGAKHPGIVAESDARLGQVAVEEFRLATGYDAEVLSVERERMPAWDSSWQALQGLRLPPHIHLHANWVSRPGIPGRLVTAKRLAERLAAETRAGATIE